MLEKKEINELRKKLNKSIIENKDYEVIYQISTDLDKLIAQYYKESVNAK
jgi:hypothetical protein